MSTLKFKVLSKEEKSDLVTYYREAKTKQFWDELKRKFNCNKLPVTICRHGKYNYAISRNRKWRYIQYPNGEMVRLSNTAVAAC